MFDFCLRVKTLFSFQCGLNCKQAVVFHSEMIRSKDQLMFTIM